MEINKPNQPYENLNGTTLAYMGDSAYELHIRRHLIDMGKTKVDKLHHAATKYVSAKAQSNIVRDLLSRGFLTEEEEEVYRRGKNRRPKTIPKNTPPQVYKEATGFEALVGFLYLKGRSERLAELVNMAIDIVEGKIK